MKKQLVHDKEQCTVKCSLPFSIREEPVLVLSMNCLSLLPAEVLLPAICSPRDNLFHRVITGGRVVGFLKFGVVVGTLVDSPN
jgi:hypothetical protein